MSRVRVSTTVDGDLLTRARAVAGSTDSKLLDEALTAFLAARRRVEIDEQIRAGYERHPLNEPDEWGDLESWLDAASRAK